MAAHDRPVNDLVGPAVAADEHRKLYASLAGEAREHAAAEVEADIVVAHRELAEAFAELGRTLLASPPGRLAEAIVARLDRVLRRVVG